MEAIVSLLIIGILMTTVISVIRFSMTMTGNSITRAEASQNDFNDIIFENYNDNPSTILISADNIVATHNIFVSIDNNGEIIAFRPEEPAPEGDLP